MELLSAIPVNKSFPSRRPHDYGYLMIRLEVHIHKQASTDRRLENVVRHACIVRHISTYMESSE